jgi:hypothetical protein
MFRNRELLAKILAIVVVTALLLSIVVAGFSAIQ